MQDASPGPFILRVAAWLPLAFLVWYLAGPVLARTWLDMSQTAQISGSLRVGRSVLDGIGAINTLHKGSVEQAGFAVLKAPDIPSILVETAFISNPDEEQKLRDEGYQRKFAASMRSGIKQYFARNPPLARADTG